MREQTNHIHDSRSRVLIAIVFTLLGLAASTRAQDQIALRGSVRLDADQLKVSLADVADLQGSVAQALGEAVIFETADPPSRPVTVHLDVVRQRLEESGANLGLLSLSGRDCVIRWRAPAAPDDPSLSNDSKKPVANDAPTFANQFIGERTVRGLVAAYLALSLLQCDPATVRLQFRPGDEQELQMATTGYEFEVKPLASALSPTMPLLINAFRGSNIVRSFRITVEVAIRQPVLVVQRYVSRGDILSPGDLLEEVRIVEPQASAPLQHAQDALGMEARGRLVPGQILRDGDMVSKVMMARNSEVWIRARHGVFVIRMRGRVLSEGRLGDVVRVQRLSDRVELMGIVDADGEVVVDTGSIDRTEDRR